MKTQDDYNRLAIKIAEELNYHNKITVEDLKEAIKQHIPSANIEVIEGNKAELTATYNTYKLHFIIFKNKLIGVKL